MMLNEVPICLELIDSAFKNNLPDTDKNFESNKQYEQPWTWFGSKSVYFKVYKDCDGIIGYVIWRRKKRISHLHSFIIKSEKQRTGIGKELLKEFEAEAILINPNCRLFTLHTYKTTEYNHKFYFSAGYVLYKMGDEKKVPGLQDWINNCKKHNDWPLKMNKLLFYKSVLKND